MQSLIITKQPDRRWGQSGSTVSNYNVDILTISGAYPSSSYFSNIAIPNGSIINSVTFIFFAAGAFTKNFDLRFIPLLDSLLVPKNNGTYSTFISWPNYKVIDNYAPGAVVDGSQITLESNATQDVLNGAFGTTWKSGAGLLCFLSMVGIGNCQIKGPITLTITYTPPSYLVMGNKGQIEHRGMSINTGGKFVQRGLDSNADIAAQSGSRMIATAAGNRLYYPDAG
jgi:hypothetical protein